MNASSEIRRVPCGWNWNCPKQSKMEALNATCNSQRHCMKGRCHQQGGNDIWHLLLSSTLSYINPNPHISFTLTSKQGIRENSQVVRMADTGKGVKTCDDRCGCTVPCPGGNTCRSFLPLYTLRWCLFKFSFILRFVYFNKKYFFI